MYIIKLTRNLPPFTKDGCTVEDFYFIGATLENLVDAVIKFGGLLTTNPNAKRERDSKILNSDDPKLQLPHEVQLAISEMVAQKREAWVVTIRSEARNLPK